MNQAKVLLKDYKQALINKNILENERFTYEVMKIALKIKSSRFWNYYYWIPLFKETENDIIRKLCTLDYRYIKQLTWNDEIDLKWRYVNNDKFNNTIESLDLIKDDFIIIDLEIVEMINRYK